MTYQSMITVKNDAVCSEDRYDHAIDCWDDSREVYIGVGLFEFDSIGLVTGVRNGAQSWSGWESIRGSYALSSFLTRMEAIYGPRNNSSAQGSGI